MYQGEYNDRNEEKQEELEERISYLEEETISNYDHILELSKRRSKEIKMAYVPIPKKIWTRLKQRLPLT